MLIFIITLLSLLPNVLMQASVMPEIVVSPNVCIGKNATDENYVFGGVAAIDEDADGNIYVLDFKFRTIKKYNGEGVFIKNIGKIGQGPGEIPQFTVDMAISDNKIYLLLIDMVIVYSLEGDYVDTIRLLFFPRFIGVDLEGNMYLISDNGPNGKMINMLDKDGRLIASYGELFEAKNSSFSRIQKKWLPYAVYMSGKGKIIIANPFRQEILIYHREKSKESLRINSRAYVRPKYNKNPRGGGYITGGIEAIAEKDGCLLLVLGGQKRGKLIEAYSAKTGEFLCATKIDADGYARITNKGNLYICDDDSITRYSVTLRTKSENYQ